jgi:VWFA-related protein
LTHDVRVLEAGVTRVDAIGGTAMRDALQTAERYLREHAMHDRRALFVITDGNDNASTLSTAECRKLVERSGAAIYAVRLVHDMSSAGKNDDELDRLAEVTGGVAEHIAAAADIEQVALEIAHRIRNEYTIAYTPANQLLDGSYRAVRVKVTRPRGLTARTRPGYWATPLPKVP